MCLSREAEEGKDQPPQPYGNSLPDATQEAVGLLCCRGTSLSQAQLIFHQDPQVLFCKTVFQLVSLQPVLVHRVISFQEKDLTFPFIDLHEIPVSALLQLVEVHLNGSTLPSYVYEDFIGDGVKSHTKIKINNIHCSLLLHGASHLIVDVY